MYGFTKRGAIRIFSFGMAALLILLGFTAYTWREKERYRFQLETAYRRALQDAADLTDAVSLSLDKQLHASGESETALFAAMLLKQSGEAKAALSSLPYGQTELSSAYRFLAQVGDYALRASREESDLPAYRQTLAELRDYARALSGELSALQSRAAAGYLPFPDGDAAAFPQPDDAAAAGNGFAAIEESFSGYPTLIYDGPFSDHMLERTPQLTAGRPSVSRETARETAAACALVDPSALLDAEDEHSRLPLYTFKAGEIVIGVTKEGGFPCYMVDGRAIEDVQAVSEETARETALRYLGYLGLSSLRETYYETANNILTINFAHYQQGTVCYPDLVKVGVALDTGRTVFFDARGYIMNHHERTLPQPILSEQEARGMLSPLLHADSVRPALIPTAGGEERLCYEFSCRGAGGEEYLCYINVETGAEEDLLKLVLTDGGVLTR